MKSALIVNFSTSASLTEYRATVRLLRKQGWTLKRLTVYAEGLYLADWTRPRSIY